MSQKHYRKSIGKRRGGLSANTGDTTTNDNDMGDSYPVSSSTTTQDQNQNQDQDQNQDQGQNQDSDQNYNEMFSWLTSSKNFAIILLFILLGLSFLGVNILLILGGVFQWFVRIFGPFVSSILSFIGYTTGTIINETSDVIADTAKTGIDIADGTLQSLGNLLKDDSNAGVNVSERIQIDNISYDINVLPSPTTLSSSVPQTLAAPPAINATIFQTPTLDSILNSGSNTSKPSPLPNMTGSSNKGSWCLTGEYNGTRGCVEMDAGDVCMSGQIYPTQAQCLKIQPNGQEGFTARPQPLSNLAIPGSISIINQPPIAADGPSIVSGQGHMNYLSSGQF